RSGPASVNWHSLDRNHWHAKTGMGGTRRTVISTSEPMMKPRKGKMERKAGGYVCTRDQAQRKPDLLVVSLPGLSWQDIKTGGTLEQVKSLSCCKTVKGEAATVGCGETMVADRIVVAIKVL
ncbi:hypothetical protein, partial [Cyclobacterium sp. SYSU L10401]|uniref:hypothetical protein n=1 Tax=Cyclobacterium sp. SYSU L10401 TaxID=2678657 RepID=UPI001969D618